MIFSRDTQTGSGSPGHKVELVSMLRALRRHMQSATNYTSGWLSVVKHPSPSELRGLLVLVTVLSPWQKLKISLHLSLDTLQEVMKGNSINLSQVIATRSMLESSDSPPITTRPYLQTLSSSATMSWTSFSICNTHSSTSQWSTFLLSKVRGLHF